MSVIINSWTGASVLGSMIFVLFGSQGCSSPEIPVSSQIYPTETVSKIKSSYASLLRNGAHTNFLSICPPNSFELEGGTSLQLPVSHSYLGSDSRIYVADGRQYAVKVVDTLDALESLCMEAAVVGVLSSATVHGVAMHPVKAGSLDLDCEGRVLVTDFAGEFTMERASIYLSNSGIARFAADAIEILSRVHSQGIIHGDIHMGNFVMKSFDEPGSLRLIDFGRSIAYVNAETGRHIHNTHVPLDTSYNRLLLSPFELEGSRRARRDDLYRLSELLYLMRGVYVPAVVVSVDIEELAHMKRRWTDNTQLDSFYTKFHHAMAALGYDEDPDYATWITGFRVLAH